MKDNEKTYFDEREYQRDLASLNAIINALNEFTPHDTFNREDINLLNSNGKTFYNRRWYEEMRGITENFGVTKEVFTLDYRMRNDVYFNILRGKTQRFADLQNAIRRAISPMRNYLTDYIDISTRTIDTDGLRKFHTYTITTDEQRALLNDLETYCTLKERLGNKINFLINSIGYNEHFPCNNHINFKRLCRN